MNIDKFKSCIEICYECAQHCDHCAVSSLHECDVNKLVKCIELSLYCADMCRLTAKFMLIGDLYVDQVSNLCAEICEACSNECAKHPHDHCQRCAAVCKRCAEECRSMMAA
ncbi:MAG: four-helix bundle copper-binding protein [Bacteroidota bacterium]|nr:four-helix bundle copper-binding protein [Bacteroidota bacterium]